MSVPVSGAAVDVFTEQQAVYGLHVNPSQEQVFIASCENGRVLLFDLRMSLAGQSETRSGPHGRLVSCNTSGSWVL